MDNYSIPQNGFSPRQFAKRNGIGVTKTYQEIKTGRLVARKCGSRTIITLEEERVWLQSLPKLSSKGRLSSPPAICRPAETDGVASDRKRAWQEVSGLRAKLERASLRGGAHE